MTHSTWWLVVNGLAVYRLSVLFSRDKIAEPVRKWIWRRGWEMVEHAQLPGRRYREKRETRLGAAGRFVWELVICPWCLSVWFAGAVVTLTRLTPTTWQYPAILLALSGLTVLATRRRDDDS